MLKSISILVVLLLAQQCQSNTEQKTISTQTEKTYINMDDTIPTREIATFGGGCFWCMEAVFQQMKGVIKIESGYSGGMIQNPTYKDVCTGSTGHAEVIQITYNPSIVSFKELLNVFFTMHDPTTLNRQGNDVGTQYRSAIFYHNTSQQQVATEIIDALNKNKVYPNPVVTTIETFNKFYKAEDYHQNYYNQNKEQGYCRYVIQPKVEKFEKIFKDKMK